jgi:hypothetical protein
LTTNLEVKVSDEQNVWLRVVVYLQAKKEARFWGVRMHAVRRQGR